ncbi:hypothetical protein G6L37_00730 [Agrobacterium rubi]|nr:hypothetical protein [Agrobacterium rubi]NTF23915.1 hypothetical protein [Agrobacterium rubi]
MELYHLDWEAEQAASPEHLLSMIVPGPDATSFETNVLDALSRGAYRKVAMITGHAPGDVFKLTQNIDDHWAEHAAPGIQPLGNNPARSTSVGDLIRDDDGVYHAVATVGLVRIGSQPRPVSPAWKTSTEKAS